MKELWSRKDLSLWQKIVGTLLMFIAKENQKDMDKDDPSASEKK